MHVPSQPLMRSLLSQFQTPTAPRRVSRFFRVWWLVRLPFRADHPAYFGSATFYFRQPFQPSTHVNLNTCSFVVNAAFQCNPRNIRVFGRDVQSIELLKLNEYLVKLCRLLHRSIHSTSKMAKSHLRSNGGTT
jgi:hypothetical protein